MVGLAAAADRSLPRAAVAAAVDAVAPGGQALWHLEQALSLGAPPLAGRQAAELIARGSAGLAVRACAACGRTGRPLTRSEAGPVCPRCRAWQLAAACSACGRVKPVATRTAAGSRCVRSAGGAPAAAAAAAGPAARPRRSRSAAAAAGRISA